MSAREHSLPNRAGAPAFKVGDRVRCIDEPEGTFGNVWAPVCGKTYEVACIAHDQLVHLRSDLEVTLSRGWQQERFELAEASAPTPEWTPGDGWREMAADDLLTERPRSEELVRYDETGRAIAAWRFEKPVPPLPTEPYTVIRVEWAGMVHTADFPDSTLTLDGDWWPLGSDTPITPSRLHERIAGFEVLAEPAVNDARLLGERERTRRETAKAVLDRIGAGLKEHGNVDPEDLYQLGLEYGVDA